MINHIGALEFVVFSAHVVTNQKVAGFVVFVIDDELKSVCGIDARYVVFDDFMNDSLIYFISRRHMVAIEQFNCVARLRCGTCMWVCLCYLSLHVTLDLFIYLGVRKSIVYKELF